MTGMKGKKHSEESKIKMSINRKGRSPWNKGIRYTAIEGDKNPAKRPEVKLKIHLAKFGKKRPESVGRINRVKMLKKWQDPEYRKKLLPHLLVCGKDTQITKESRSNFVLPVRDTNIELKVQEYLKELGIKFIKHKYIAIKYAYQCDIFIPSMNLVIECDGDYWHGNLDLFDYRKLPLWIKLNRIKDFEKDYQLEEKGYKVLRLWENEINKMTTEDLKNKMGAIVCR